MEDCIKNENIVGGYIETYPLDDLDEIVVICNEEGKIKNLNTRKEKDMMYNEFVNGTGCKENEYNYKVYENLEILYMNSDMSKEEIYEYGKKLVDNSKSEAEIEAENAIKEEIETLKAELKEADKERKRWKDSRDYWKSENESKMEKVSFDMLKICRNDCRRLRSRINELKSLLVA